MTALVPPRQEPLTLKQAVRIHGLDWLKKQPSDELILIRVVHSRNGGKYLRQLMPDIWGKTFVFTDRAEAKRFLLSLEDVVRARVRGGNLGGAIRGVRWLVSFLIERHDLA